MEAIFSLKTDKSALFKGGYTAHRPGRTRVSMIDLTRVSPDGAGVDLD